MGHVTLSIHTENLQGPATKSVTVTTNDPATPQLFLSAKIEVVGSVKILPMESLLLRARSGVPAGGRLLIRKDPTETGELKVGAPTATATWLAVTATPVSEARPRGNDGLPPALPGDWVLEAHVKDDAPPLQGRRHETITFATGLPRQPTVTVPAILDVKPPVNFPVDRLMLKRDGQGPAEATIFASVRADLDPTALRVEARPAGLEAKVEPSATPRIVTLRVTWKGGPLSGGVVTLTIGDEKVRLPVEDRAVQRPGAPGATPG